MTDDDCKKYNNLIFFHLYSCEMDEIVHESDPYSPELSKYMFTTNRIR